MAQCGDASPCSTSPGFRSPHVGLAPSGLPAAALCRGYPNTHLKILATTSPSVRSTAAQTRAELKLATWNDP